MSRRAPKLIRGHVEIQHGPVRVKPPRSFRSRNPGTPWRAQGQEDGFDEIAVADWLHIERMDHRAWWCRIGQTTFFVHVSRKDGRHVEIVFQDGPEIRAGSKS